MAKEGGERETRFSAAGVPGKSAFRRERRQFSRLLCARLGSDRRFHRSGRGCAWIFDRRASPQWEICTAKRITDVFVPIGTMGTVDSSLSIPWFEVNRGSFHFSFLRPLRDVRAKVITLRRNSNRFWFSTDNSRRVVSILLAWSFLSF